MLTPLQALIESPLWENPEYFRAAVWALAHAENGVLAISEHGFSRAMDWHRSMTQRFIKALSHVSSVEVVKDRNNGTEIRFLSAIGQAIGQASLPEIGQAIGQAIGQRTLPHTPSYLDNISILDLDLKERGCGGEKTSEQADRSSSQSSKKSRKTESESTFNVDLLKLPEHWNGQEIRSTLLEFQAYLIANEKHANPKKRLSRWPSNHGPQALITSWKSYTQVKFEAALNVAQQSGYQSIRPSWVPEITGQAQVITHVHKHENKQVSNQQQALELVAELKEKANGKARDGGSPRIPDGWLPKLLSDGSGR
jgi:hypothetical protein